MMAAKHVLAINTDREAPMVAKADYAVIGDLHEIVPAISEEIHAQAARRRATTRHEPVASPRCGGLGVRALASAMARQHLLGGGGHVDVLDAEVAERIDHGRLHRGRAADGAALADALGAERVDRRRGLHVDDLEARQLGGRDHRVVGEVRRDRVAVVVVADLFEQRLGGALGDATVDLAVEQQRVQHPTGVVAGDVAEVA